MSPQRLCGDPGPPLRVSAGPSTLTLSRVGRPETPRHRAKAASVLGRPSSFRREAPRVLVAGYEPGFTTSTARSLKAWQSRVTSQGGAASSMSVVTLRDIRVRHFRDGDSIIMLITLFLQCGRAGRMTCKIDSRTSASCISGLGDSDPA